MKTLTINLLTSIIPSSVEYERIHLGHRLNSLTPTHPSHSTSHSIKVFHRLHLAPLSVTLLTGSSVPAPSLLPPVSAMVYPAPASALLVEKHLCIQWNGRPLRNKSRTPKRTGVVISGLFVDSHHSTRASIPVLNVSKVSSNKHKTREEDYVEHSSLPPDASGGDSQKVRR
ncbi:hypothetical protein E2C01_020547 [Portunus trituberculatus]|uniref:Uncharacterized protein n=1 Tax=Portunus trituberculatus TaxID=210409 RepID=A0A5B7E2K7_PORTR|nr:hypothetical protein [Portunus trituberculatus]